MRHNRLAAMGMWAVLAMAGIARSAEAKDLSSVAKLLAKGMSKLENKYVAVLPFTYAHDEVSSGSQLVADRLMTELVNRNVRVVERSQLEKVVGEIKLEMSGAVDAVNAQKLGKMLGVDAVVTGTLNDFENRETEVNARLIRTETGEILAAGTTIIPRPWMDFPRKVFADTVIPTSDSSSSKGSMSVLIPVHFGANGPGEPGKDMGHRNRQASADGGSGYGGSVPPMPTYQNAAVTPGIYHPPTYNPPPYNPPPYVPAPSRSR